MSRTAESMVHGMRCITVAGSHKTRTLDLRLKTESRCPSTPPFWKTMCNFRQLSRISVELIPTLRYSQMSTTDNFSWHFVLNFMLLSSTYLCDFL